MRLGKRHQARRITPPPVQEAVPPPPRLPMASFPTGPFDVPMMGYGPDGSPTDGYRPDGSPMGYPDGQPWMPPAPGGPPPMAYGPEGRGFMPEGQPWVPQDGQPWVGDVPGGFPPMAYAFEPDGGPVLYSPGVPPPPWQPEQPRVYDPPPSSAYGPPPGYEPQPYGQAPPTHEPPPHRSHEALAPYEPRQAYEPVRPPAPTPVQQPTREPVQPPAPAPVQPPRPEPAQPPPPEAPQAYAPAEPAEVQRQAASTHASVPPDPQVIAEPDLADIPLWPDFAPERRADPLDGSGNGVERLPTATQAHRLRLDRPVEQGSVQRSADSRLGRLHIRGGMLGLARASLEQLAGTGSLDRESLADLAEARWRAGDLEGAAEAAEAHLQARGDEPIARVIAAEQAAQEGRILDARQLATQVHGQVGDGLERLFAGEPRSAVWPPAAPARMDASASLPGRYGLLVGGAEVADPGPETWPTVPMGDQEEPRVPASPSVLVHTAQHATPFKVSAQDATEASREVDRELQAAERDLSRGDLVALADRLGLLLRRDPGLAPVILSIAEHALAVSAERGPDGRATAVGASSDMTSGNPGQGGPPLAEPGVASLQMLRGDIHRGLGRESDATQAYQEALRALPGRAITREST